MFAEASDSLVQKPPTSPSSLDVPAGVLAALPEPSQNRELLRHVFVGINIMFHTEPSQDRLEAAQPCRSCANTLVGSASGFSP